MSSPKIQEALDFAAKYHSGQFRKEIPLPFIIHPLEVVKQLAYWGINQEEYEAMWIAALLHDTVEDTNATIQDIESQFGDNVATMVYALTHNPIYTKEEYMIDITKGCVRPFVIKLADRICNVRDFKHKNYTYAKKYFYKAEILWDGFILRQREIENSFGKNVAYSIGGSIAIMRMDF